MNDKRFELDGTGIFDNKTNRFFYKTFDNEEVVDLLNELVTKCHSLEKENNILYNENIQLRRILVNYKDLINDVKYLEEKGVFDGKKDKKNIWDVEPVVEKHS